MEKTVDVLIIDHKHGRNIYVCHNYMQILFEYVQDWWCFAKKIPTDKQTAINFYFDYMFGQESYDYETNLTILE